MFPSAEPVTKKSSVESMARALIAESCAWNVWSSCLWRISKIHTKPFLPPVMISCCLGAYWRTVAPFSWHWNAEKQTTRECFHNATTSDSRSPSDLKSMSSKHDRMEEGLVCELTVYHSVTGWDQSVPQTNVSAEETDRCVRWALLKHHEIKGMMYLTCRHWTALLLRSDWRT